MNHSALRALAVLAGAAFSTSLATPVLAQDEPALLQAGVPAPDFVSKGFDGREIRLADYHGKVIVLDFWATWCGPCKASLPHVEQVAAAHAQDVVVLAVCTSDTRAKFDAFVADNRAKYPHIVFACDPNERGTSTFDQRASQALYHVEGLPTKFVIGRDGKIAMTMVGYEDGDAQLEAGLARAGIAIDAATAKKGEEQNAKAAKEAADQAAEAAANPPPPFWPMFGSRKAGEAMPDFPLVGADGKEFAAASLYGKPTVLVFAWDEIMPRAELQDMAQRYARYGVQVVGVMEFSTRESFTAWVAQNGKDAAFRIAWDPAGKFEAKDGNADLQARLAFNTRTAVAKFFTGNMMPGMPAALASDGAGKLLGAFGLAKRGEALGNLLLHAGIQLAPEDMPKVRVADDKFVAPAPPKPEAEVAMIQVGAMAPDFTMQDVAGKDVKLSDFRGKVVVLDFWATWCGPCKASMPHTDEVADHYADQGVVVLASCTSDARKAFETWVRQHQQDFPHMTFAHDAAERGESRASHKLYGVRGIPQQFIVDRDGKIVAETGGYMAGEVLLEAALAKAGVKVDPAILAKAVEDQRKRDALREQAKPAKAMPAVKMQ